MRISKKYQDILNHKAVCVIQSTDTLFNCCTSGTAHDVASICLVIKTYSYIAAHTKVLYSYV